MEKQIPVYSFLTAQFLIYFEKNKYNNNFKDIHQSFLENLQTEPKIRDFNYINIGTIAMFCYALIVYPKELGEKLSQAECENLENLIKYESVFMGISIDSIYDLFVSINPRPKDIYELIKLLRHSIAHAHIDIKNENELLFWNIDREGVKFEAAISISNLSIILSAIGKFYINIKRIGQS